MVDHRLGDPTGLHLKGLDATFLGTDVAYDGNDRAMPHIEPSGRHVDGCRRREQVRLAEQIRQRPVVGVVQVQRRNLVRVTQRRTLVDPGRDRVDVLLGETPVLFEVLDADVIVVVVRRHQAVDDLVLDEGRIHPDVLVGHELHGSNPTGAVADRAVLLDDGCDVRGVGQLCVIRRRERCLSVGRTLESECRDERNSGSGDPRPFLQFHDDPLPHNGWTTLHSLATEQAS